MQERQDAIEGLAAPRDHADAGRMHRCRIVVVSFVLDDLTWNSCLYGQAGFSMGPLSWTESVAIVTYVPHLVCLVIAGAAFMDRIGGYRNLRASFGLLSACSAMSLLSSVGVYLA